MTLREFPELRTAVAFSLVGPPLGQLAMSIGFFIQNPSGIVDVIFGAPVLLVLSYLVGFVPALLSGIFFGLVCRLLFRSNYPSYWICSLLGAVVGFSFTLGWLLTITRSIANISDALLFCSIGAFAGCSCALIAKWRSVGSNNSFKPKPLRGSA